MTDKDLVFYLIRGGIFGALVGLVGAFAVLAVGKTHLSRPLRILAGCALGLAIGIAVGIVAATLIGNTTRIKPNLFLTGVLSGLAGGTAGCLAAGFPRLVPAGVAGFLLGLLVAGGYFVDTFMAGCGGFLGGLAAYAILQACQPGQPTEIVFRVFRCRDCGHRTRIPEQAVVKSLSCRSCGRVFRLNNRSQKPAPTPPGGSTAALAL